MKIRKNLTWLQQDFPSILKSKLNTISTRGILLFLFILTTTALIYYHFHCYSQTKYLKRKLAESNAIISTTWTTPEPAPCVPCESIPPIEIFTSKYEFGFEIWEEFNKILQEYKGQIIPDNEGYVWWISDDSLNILNLGETGLIYQNYSRKLNPKGKEMYNDISTGLAEGIRHVMSSSGFSMNKRNSSQSIADDRFYDYVQAYEKGDMKCTLTADPDEFAWSFVCTNSLAKNYQEQAPYLKDMNITGAVIRVKKKIGDYAKIDVHSRRMGGFIIAQRIDGVWTALFSGNDSPDCRKMREHQVPQEISGCDSL